MAGEIELSDRAGVARGRVWGGAVLERSLVDAVATAHQRRIALPMRTIPQSEAALRRLGLVPRLGTNEALADYAVRALEDVRRRRIDLPAYVWVDDDPFIDRAIVQYDRHRDEIQFRPSDPVWQGSAGDIRAAVRVLRQRRWISSDAEFHPVVHELGHRAHWRQSRDAFEHWLGRDWPMRHEHLLPTIRQQVSGYAAESPMEFAAEVYAGLVAGRRFPAVMMELYEQLGGPEL